MGKVFGLVNVWRGRQGATVAVVFAKTGHCPEERGYCLRDYSLGDDGPVLCPHFCEVDTEEDRVLIDCAEAAHDDEV